MCQAVRRRQEELHKITQTKLNAERGQMRVGVRAETKQKVLLSAGAISSSVGYPSETINSLSKNPPPELESEAER